MKKDLEKGQAASPVAMRRMAVARDEGSHSGVFVISDDQFAEVEKCTANPAAPSQAMHNGAKILQRYLRK